VIGIAAGTGLRRNSMTSANCASRARMLRTFRRGSLMRGRASRGPHPVLVPSRIAL
jgi:hypothetical protein